MKKALPAGYLAIKAEADRIDLPRSFHTDLTKHDRSWIAKHPSAPFVWIPRDCGTFLCLVTHEPLDGVHSHAWDAPRWNKDERGVRFYVWTGGERGELRHFETAEQCSAAIRELAEQKP